MKQENTPSPRRWGSSRRNLFNKATTGKIKITDVTGKQLKSLSLNKGNNQIELNGNELGYGIFFYTLYINDEFIETKKMVRIR